MYRVEDLMHMEHECNESFNERDARWLHTGSAHRRVNQASPKIQKYENIYGRNDPIKINQTENKLGSLKLFLKYLTNWKYIWMNRYFI